MNQLFSHSKVHHVCLQLSQITSISGRRGFLLSDMCQQMDGELMRGLVPTTHHLVTVGQQGGQNILVHRKHTIPILYNFSNMLGLILQILKKQLTLIQFNEEHPPHSETNLIVIAPSLKECTYQQHKLLYLFSLKIYHALEIQVQYHCSVQFFKTCFDCSYSYYRYNPSYIEKRNNPILGYNLKVRS